ncbi:MAG: malto-oligosyltrehalose synthase [Candidatus Kuenenia sp.]|nr:malto-oligosyltrehalose synthase [Candidatus Kuenenia hertensis]
MASAHHPNPRIPVATYRLQLNKHFTFKDTKEIVGYLHSLGISDIYCSPYLKAREGSLHGYDVVDHNSLNPEIGTEQELDELVHELCNHGMGQIFDLVPNHMGIASKENMWWMDMLENGMSSWYADFFDIDWNPVKDELKNKILLPVLGDQYGNILDSQELTLRFENGAFFIDYYDHKFPLRPQTYLDILRHRLEELEETLSEENPHLTELLSILTAIDHLPAYTETEEEKIRERYREKEVIKKRLYNLYNESQEIQHFIDTNVVLFNGQKGITESFDLLDSLLDKQVYRLSHWRVATEEINYRRFFDISDLAATRVEILKVFRETHELVFRLVREGKVTGLRVDHPDGLYCPPEYFKELQWNCYLLTVNDNRKNTGNNCPSEVEQSEKNPALVKQYNEILTKEPHYKPFYIVGEKILGKSERIPEDWPIFGTTGYDFLATVNGIFVETRNAKDFDKMYSRFIKKAINFHEVIYERKKLIMQVAMSSEINTLGHYLNRISEKNRHTRDFTLNSLTYVIIEVIACFPVYRTYIHSPVIDERDRRYVESAVSKAKRKNPALNESIFFFLKDVLLNNYPGYFTEKDKKEWLDFTMKFQQITGPVMAKGVEDTIFYVYNRLISLNEVGGNPDWFGISIDAFHGQNTERARSWQHSMLTTSTHDTKRSEDVRARINVLSEIPAKWRECVIRWSRINKKHKRIVEDLVAPDKNEEYLFYQTLIGAWPIEPMDDSGYEIFKNRIKEYMLKALREAKVNTSWINPHTTYEEGLMYFIDSVMKRKQGNTFLHDFKKFQKEISHCGIYNSLAQTLLKITSPGIPDIYQGNELWSFCLVDPDNRRPVDYDIRIKMLAELKEQETTGERQTLIANIMKNRENSMIKLYVTYKALTFRKENRELFETASYIPLEVTGSKGHNVCAFARNSNTQTILVVVPRFMTQILSNVEELPFGENVWEDTFLILPFENNTAGYRNIFTGEMVTAKNIDGITRIFLSEIFTSFPVALMERIYYE